MGFRRRLDALRTFVDGRLKLYCVSSFDRGSWTRDDLPLEERARRHGVYERWLADPGVRAMVAKVYSAWDMKTAIQGFRREVTPELIRALSST